MTLEKLKELNPHLSIYGVDSEEFAEYGCRISGIDVSEIVKVGSEISFPEEGSIYVPSQPEFEALDIAEKLRKQCFGELPTQVGYCYGHNHLLNGWEWHTSSEINIAVTDLVLLLAKRSEMKDGKIDSSAAKAFLLKAGDIVEVYATSLHFCPCETAKSGFGCVVALPTGTNVPLEEAAQDPLLFRKNKWLIAHEKNEGLIQRGVVPGISGENLEVKGE